MREEMQQMRASLEMLIRQGAVLSTPNQPLVGHNEVRTPQTDIASPVGTSLPTREDNMHMAMTRENSLEPSSCDGQYSDGSVTMEEPMGSLYEVTRLRNIRSNKAKTVRPAVDGDSELKDFISRGVISQPEAEELYRRYVTLICLPKRAAD
jgi:hypothetical protein